jgi:hypothetical protein
VRATPQPYPGTLERGTRPPHRPGTPRHPERAENRPPARAARDWHHRWGPRPGPRRPAAAPRGVESGRRGASRATPILLAPRSGCRCFGSFPRLPRFFCLSPWPPPIFPAFFAFAGRGGPSFLIWRFHATRRTRAILRLFTAAPRAEIAEATDAMTGRRRQLVRRYERVICYFVGLSYRSHLYSHYNYFYNKNLNLTQHLRSYFSMRSARVMALKSSTLITLGFTAYSVILFIADDLRKLFDFLVRYFKHLPYFNSDIGTSKSALLYIRMYHTRNSNDLFIKLTNNNLHIHCLFT